MATARSSTLRMLRGLATAALVLGLLGWSGPADASSADELVDSARGYERARDVDTALRRYMDALALDPTHEGAYLGLASLRARLGDLREADLVYTSLLERRPQSAAAWLGRARVRRGLGRADAEADVRRGASLDPSLLKELAAWRAEEGRRPAQLAVWREVLAVAAQCGNAPLAEEARTMVRALALVVGPADPVTAPAFETPLRRALVRLTPR